MLISSGLDKKYFVVISFAVAQAASRLRLSVANGEIYNTNMYKDVSTPVGPRSTSLRAEGST